MSTSGVRGRLRWPLAVPVLALLVLSVAWVRHDHWAVLAVVAVALVGSIVAAVHHAEVVAHKVGSRSGR